MHYVVSDIHGEYDKFLELLKKIDFKDTDTMYILGDMIDRGPKSIPLLLDLSMRHNVICLLGNHEYMMSRVLDEMAVEITEENAENRLTVQGMQAYMDWTMNGGESTISQFRALSADDKDGIIDFLNELSLFEMVKAGDRKYILVHAGFSNFSNSRPLESYLPEELVFERLDYSVDYFENIYVIVGHTPTLLINEKAEIYHEGNFINIDCGATFEGGRLACLCLENLEEFYI